MDFFITSMPCALLSTAIQQYLSYYILCVDTLTSSQQNSPYTFVLGTNISVDKKVFFHLISNKILCSVSSVLAPPGPLSYSKDSSKDSS